MRVQYISDIHLEMYKDLPDSVFDNFIIPDAPYLALCGDIGIPDLKNYEKFISWCSSRWDKVFVLAGNHEYYNFNCPKKTDMEAKKTLIQRACEGHKNVHFLDCSSILLENERVRVIGCTLWSEIDQKTIDDPLKSTNDYRQILLQGTKPAFAFQLRELHYKEKSWLQQEIHKADMTGEQCLILTHYLPSYDLIAPKYRKTFDNSFFASHCDDLIRPPVKGWICGHSHTGMNLQIHGIPCVLNPYGYPDEQIETRSKVATLTI
jgi:hypothetical protein